MNSIFYMHGNNNNGGNDRDCVNNNDCDHVNNKDHTIKDFDTHYDQNCERDDAHYVSWSFLIWMVVFVLQ